MFIRLIRYDPVSRLLCREAVFGSTRGTKYKALRSVVLEVVRFSVHDVVRLHTGSLHSCYQMLLPYRTVGSTPALPGWLH